MKIQTMMAAATLAMLAAGSASAAADPVYSPAGTINPTNYTFEAVATGDVYAYFLSESASYTETLGMAANNSTTALGATGLSNQTSHRGNWIDLGHVTAGEIVTFFIHVSNTGLTFSSETSLNADGTNHVYSTSFPVAGALPAGTFISFEDLDTKVSDHDYNDTAYDITNVRAVPEPASIGLMLAGLGLMGAVARRRRGN
jgi:hypothetical protein